MVTAAGQLEPLPGGVYAGTIMQADVYPQVRGIGGITTQDRALPAYGEATVRAAANPVTTPISQHLGKPAGWLLVALVAVAYLAWDMREGR